MARPASAYWPARSLGGAGALPSRATSVTYTGSPLEQLPRRIFTSTRSVRSAVAVLANEKLQARLGCFALVQPASAATTRPAHAAGDNGPLLR
jgi:hypothetical protein